MRSKFKISIAAMPIRPCVNIHDLELQFDRYARQAEEAGSEILLLPELSCIGLLWGEPDIAAVTNADIAAFYRRGLNKHLPAYRDMLSRIAAVRNLWIAGASYWHSKEGAGRNTGFMVGPDGQILTQDKLHLTRPEQVIGTVGGSALKTFDVNGVSCGLLICYDAQFPELARSLLDRGVEVLLVPSLTTERGYWRVRYAAQARAQENQFYVCVSPLIGRLDIPVDHPSDCAGHAYVACPIDNRFGIVDGVYAQTPMNEEAVLNVTLDLDLLRLSRAKGEIRNVLDRRQELYPTLT